MSTARALVVDHQPLPPSLRGKTLSIETPTKNKYEYALGRLAQGGQFTNKTSSEDALRFLDSAPATALLQKLGLTVTYKSVQHGVLGIRFGDMRPGTGAIWADPGDMVRHAALIDLGKLVCP